MMHSACRSRGKHLWGLWYPHVDQLGGLKEPPYMYRRECQAMGCDIAQLTEDLISPTRPKEIDTHETEKALAEHDKLKKEANK